MVKSQKKTNDNSLDKFSSVRNLLILKSDFFLKRTFFGNAHVLIHTWGYEINTQKIIHCER